MSSNTGNLPPYEEKSSLAATGASTSGIAEAIRTCSIRDNQVDYLTIVRESGTSYHVALTVDPTPLYRIEIVPFSTKIGDIQIFSASDATLPVVAAARLSADPKNKSQPIATICTTSPIEPNALWRPIIRPSSLFAANDIQSNIPIVTVPGRAATPHQFKWRTLTAKPYYQLMWEGPLPLEPASSYMKDERGSEYVFATLARKAGDGEENLVEIRRGGGLEFELSVLLQLFIILQLEKVQLI